MTRASALLSCTACFLLSHIASAKPKVALTQIEGDASGDVRDAVVEALEGKELSLIGSREVNRAVDKIGDLSDLTEKDFKKLATELEADAVVTGKLDRIGAARTLKFRLFVHKKMAKGFTVSFRDAKSEKFRSMLHDKMLDKIGVTAGGEDEDDARPARKKKAGADDEEDPLATRSKKSRKAKADDEDDARPAKKAKLAKADDEDARPARKKAAEADEDARPARKKAAEADDDTRPARKASGDGEAKPAGDDAAPGKSGDDEDAPRKAKKRVASADDGDEVEGGVAATAEPPRGANRSAIRLDAGASVVQRTFKFNSAAIPNKPRNVAIKPVPGARFDGEVYPLALTGSQGVAANLGLGFAYDKTFSLNLSATNPNTSMTYAVPAKQSQYQIGLRYRLAFGRTETSPTLTLGASYGKSLFSTDRSSVMNDDIANTAIRRDTPETEYTMLVPGLMFRLPVTRMVAFSLGGQFMLITNAGPIQHASSYGRARVYGGEGTAAVDIVLTRHIGLRFSGEFSQVGYAFLGGGALANGLDGDPKTQDVGGLADRSLGGAATLSVLY